ncbi:MAG: vWA domain-containing protein [bacterium]
MSVAARSFGDLTAHVVGFCRRLRARGFAVGPKETVDALRALSAVDVADRRECYLALRTVLTSRKDDLAVFDAVFEDYWNPPQEAGEHGPQTPEPLESAGDGQAPPPALMEWLDEALQPQGEEPMPAYSPIETLMQKDFSAFTAEELNEVTRLVIAIARRVATRLSRRTRATRRTRRLDLRRTIRHSLRRGGEIIDLAYRRRKIQKTRVVLLADVSGSMDLYSRFLIQFVYALQHALGQVETLVFSTSLTRITDAMSEDDLRRALDEVSKQVPDWSGGTKIGASLRAFLNRYGGTMLTPRTVVIVISDGWDTGDIDMLERAMVELQRRVGRVIWLNPLLGSPGYEPICQGMRAALPYVDIFASAHNLESLRQLERHLAARQK